MPAGEGVTRPIAKPTWLPLPLMCKACQHRWDDWQPSGIPLDRAAAYFAALTCPACSAESDQVVIVDSDRSAQQQGGFW